MTTLKTYRAPTMALALAEVKKDLGKEAVIVNTRSLKAGGWMGLGAKPMIEITASAPAPVATPRRPDRSESTKARETAKPREAIKAPEAKSPQIKSSMPRMELPSASPAGAFARSAARPEARREPSSTPPSKSSFKLVVEPHAVPLNDRVLGDAADDEWTPLQLGTAIFLTDAEDEPATPAPSKPKAGPAMPVLKPAPTPAPIASVPSSAPPVPIEQTRSEFVTRLTSDEMAEPLAREVKPLDRATEMSESSSSSRCSSSSSSSSSLVTAPSPAAIVEPVVLPSSPCPAHPSVISTTTPSPASRASLEDEVASLKRLMGQVLRYSRDAAMNRARDGAPTNTTGLLSSGNLFSIASTARMSLLDIYTALHDTGMPAELIDEIVSGVQTDLISGIPANIAGLREIALRRIAKAIPVVTTPVQPGRQPDGRPLTIALVGPTGVGKTTTIAKLAALYKLRQGRSVGLITTDTYRIAAVEQLRTYAKIIQLPLKVAEDAQDVAEAAAELAGCDCLLIDTAGRSPADQTRLGELSTAIRIARPHETHLVLAATTAEPVLLRTIDRFRALGPDRLILTKLDEAVSLGSIAAVPAKANMPVSYITVGQEVPDDIEPADAMRLAQRIAPDLMTTRASAPEPVTA